MPGPPRPNQTADTTNPAQTDKASAGGAAQFHQSDTLEQDLYRRFSRKGIRKQRIRRLYSGACWHLVVQTSRLFRRALDVMVSASVLMVLSPVLVMAMHLAGGKWKRTRRVGRWCEPFDQLSLALPTSALGRVLHASGFDRLPALVNVLRGEMSLVGPRAAAPGELSPQQRLARRRYDVRPGLISLWWIRQRANIAYGSEAESDAEYIESQSLRGDIGLMLRAAPAALFGGPAGTAADVVKLLGLRVDNLTMSEAVESIVALMDSDQSAQVAFVNADCANIAFRNLDYRRVLNEARLTLADGIGMKLAGKLLGCEIRQNVNGTDLFPRLCAAIEGSDRGVFLLGARPGIAEAVREWIGQNYPGVLVKGVQHGYFTPEEESEVIRKIAQSGASLLLVAFGAPRQDLWVSEHLGGTGVKVAMGVGGLFDFYSGRIPRAPLWMREIGMEWFYRFLQEPGRMWKRYFVGNAVFLYRLIRERRQSQHS